MRGSCWSSMLIPHKTSYSNIPFHDVCSAASTCWAWVKMQGRPVQNQQLFEEVRSHFSECWMGGCGGIELFVHS